MKRRRFKRQRRVKKRNEKNKKYVKVFVSFSFYVF